MARNQILNEKRAIAARHLAAGMATVDVARELKVSTRTLSRWKSSEDFQQQVEKFTELLTPPTEALEALEAQEWAADVESHLDFLKQAAKTARVAGLNSATRAMRRLKDLPDEALKPGDAIALLRASTELMRAAVDFESEALGLYALAERLKEDDK